MSAAAYRSEDTRPLYRQAIERKHGEDPGRWLDQDLLDSPAWSTVQARIRGIRDLDLLEHWECVERDLGRGRDGGPRNAVMTRLQARREVIQESDTLDTPIEELPRIERPSTESEPTWVYEDPQTGEVERTTTRTSAVSTQSSVPWESTLDQILDVRAADEDDGGAA